MNSKSITAAVESICASWVARSEPWATADLTEEIECTVGMEITSLPREAFDLWMSALRCRDESGLDYDSEENYVARQQAAQATPRVTVAQLMGGCSCEMEDDGGPESGPHLSVTVSEDCPHHGRVADPEGWAERDREDASYAAYELAQHEYAMRLAHPGVRDASVIRRLADESIAAEAAHYAAEVAALRDVR